MSDRPTLKGVVVEAAGPSDMEAGAKIFASAMGREGAHIEEWLLSFSTMLVEAGIGRFTVAKYRSEPVGYGGLVAYQHIGWIGFMGTQPDLQGLGIGTSIMRALLELAEELRLKTLKLDATNIGEKLYSKFGFIKEYPARRIEIPGRCVRGTRRDGIGSGVRIVDSIPEWCSALDRRAFGDDRSPLISASLRRGGKLLLAGEQGFGLLEGKKLGPVIATTAEAAKAIVRWGAGLGANVAYIPLHPDLARGFLSDLKQPKGRNALTCCTRMIKGNPVKQELGLVYGDYSAATG
jgi:GNAT superfamily N-acetyltransferase